MRIETRTLNFYCDDCVSSGHCGLVVADKLLVV